MSLPINLQMGQLGLCLSLTIFVLTKTKRDEWDKRVNSHRKCTS